MAAMAAIFAVFAVAPVRVTVDARLLPLLHICRDCPF
jgi:hypothetical protein